MKSVIIQHLFNAELYKTEYIVTDYLSLRPEAPHQAFAFVWTFVLFIRVIYLVNFSKFFTDSVRRF